MAQTSTKSSTTPTNAAESQPVEQEKTVTITQSDADRCANNTRDLIAARDEIKTYIAEIAARDKRDVSTEKVIATYEKLLTALDTIIAAQNDLSANKDALIKEQSEFIKTFLQMKQKKGSKIEAALGFAAGIFLGRAF